MKFEHYSQPVISKSAWLWRIVRAFGIVFMMMTVALGIGICGYHFLGGISWIDSVLEASMILSGMGSVVFMKNDSVKIFASIYALFSGLFLLSSLAIIFAPWLHRLLHHFHADLSTHGTKPAKNNALGSRSN